MASRRTIQRALVYEAVINLQNHATAEAVYEEVSLKHPTISRATVYRNLHVLVEEGKIRRLVVPGGADCYDHVPVPHYHIRCEKCGKMFDVDMDLLPGLDKLVRDAHGFEFTGHDLIFRGICPVCREKHTKEGREDEKQHTI